MFHSRRISHTLGLGIASLSFASAAQAGISQITIHVEATNSQGTGSHDITIDMGDFDPGAGTYYWEGDNIAIVGGGVAEGGLIATITHLAVSIIEDPMVSLFFSVENGSEETNFLFQSALVSFTTIDIPEALASAALTLTDGNGDGASLSGNGPTGGSYLAQYNGMVPGGTTFVEGLSELSTGPGTSSTSFLNYPGGGAFTTLGTSIANISSQFAFSLSAFDEASGTSNFVVQASVIPLPAPLALGLAGLGGVVVSRIRRRHAA